MASKRQERQLETRFKVMRLVDQNPSITTREIANLVGISNGAAYYCITALVDKGFVKLKNFKKSQNKMHYLYELTPRGIRTKAALTTQFLEQKQIEFNDLKAEIQGLENELGLGIEDRVKNKRGSL